MKLSKLFHKVLKEGKRGTIPILETRVLLRALMDIPFFYENEGTEILKDLTNCIENNWYSSKDHWNCKTIVSLIESLQYLVLYNYEISGSFVKFNDNHIDWDLKVSITPGLNNINKKKASLAEY